MQHLLSLTVQACVFACVPPARPPQPPNRLLAALAPYVSPAAGQPYLVDLAADLGRPVNLRLSDRSCVELDCNLNINAALGRLSNAVGRRQHGGRLVPCLTSVAWRYAWRLASCNKTPSTISAQFWRDCCRGCWVVFAAGAGWRTRTCSAMSTGWVCLAACTASVP